MDNTSSDLSGWIKKCLQKKFENMIEKDLEKSQECSDIVYKIIHSREMCILVNSMKTVIAEQHSDVNVDSLSITERCSQSSLSLTNDLATDYWNSPKYNKDQYSYIIDKISCDKPVHVRLAGFEILLKNDLSNINTNPKWDILKKTLRDGLAAESHPIFEASLQVHAKLLNSSMSYDAYTNLLSAFNAQYHSPNLYETIPTFTSGINFKLFLHEKLLRLMHLIIRHQEEMLKCIRNVDKTAEEIIEQFIIFLSTHLFGDSMQSKTLNTLNIVSVLDPQADWSKRWTHSLATRKVFITMLAKSPSLLQHTLKYVYKGLKNSPVYMSTSISDELHEVCIPGDTIKTVTYLHCLTFLSQLCSYEEGRKLLSESPLETPFSMPKFMIALVNSLNILSSSEAPNGIYNVTYHALQNIINKSITSYDTKFYDVALHSLVQSSEIDLKLWPHTLYIMAHMLDTVDGYLFMISESTENSTISEKIINCPALIVMQHLSNVIKQPFSIINVEYIFELSKVVEKLFYMFNVYEIIQNVVQQKFYSAISHFYKKLDKYLLENQSKAQHLDSIIKKLLLKIVSVPFGLQDLICEPLVFEELIRGCITPLRNSWTSTEIMSFIPSSSFFYIGYQVLEDLAPHVLSTLLSETCQVLEDPQHFYDPWDMENITKFLHILALFSLNFKCFSAFMVNTNELDNIEDKPIPSNLSELLYCSVSFESPYHYLGLLSLNTTIWNLDIYIYLIKMLNFQNELLDFQEYCLFNTQTEDEVTTQYIMDEHSLLRHKILINSFYVIHKCNNIALKDNDDIEEYKLFSKLPPPTIHLEIALISEIDSDSELENILQESKPGLLDSNWILQVRNAYINSPGKLKNLVFLALLDQMWQATPTAEWADHYNWQESTFNTHFFFPEEMYAIDLVLQYGQLNKLIANTTEIKENLKQFLQAAYTFINYQRSNKYEGFDWFLSTVFIICEGDMEKCKLCITQFIRFPSTMFVWTILGKAIDKNNNEECTIQFIFAQMLENIITDELPSMKYALKDTCGTSWWMICNAMLTQCFWGILPWHQIMHFLAISILYPPDYILYYCVSLAYHCQSTFMQNITDGKMWPEYMILDNFQCQDYISFMDNLAKRYGNKVLPLLTGRKFYSCNEEFKI